MGSLCEAEAFRPLADLISRIFVIF